MRPQTKAAFDAFHRAYYEESESVDTRLRPTWLGVPTHQLVFDLFLLQDLIFRLNPERIIECGSEAGGTALFLASICDMVKKGRVISIDIVAGSRPYHDRITWLYGNALSDEVINDVRLQLRGEPSVMVLLDDHHGADHVLREMEIYSQFVTPGSYLIVEDTNINGHPVAPGWGAGPWEAVEKFLPRHSEFVLDTEIENRFGITYFPHGFLRRL